MSKKMEYLTRLSNFMDPRFFDYFIELHEKAQANRKHNETERFIDLRNFITE
jgi:hypothetical protein